MYIYISIIYEIDMLVGSENCINAHRNHRIYVPNSLDSNSIFNNLER